MHETDNQVFNSLKQNFKYLLYYIIYLNHFCVNFYKQECLKNINILSTMLMRICFNLIGNIPNFEFKTKFAIIHPSRMYWVFK